jgi:hypothetical protein
MSQAGIQVGERLFAERELIDKEIGIPVVWKNRPDGRRQVVASKKYDPLRGPSTRDEQIDWFRTVINAFVNAFRPRVITLWREIGTQQR